MNTNTNENSNSENENEGAAPENETVEEKAERLENQNKQLYARAKKAEGFELVDGKWVKPTKVAETPVTKKTEETPTVVTPSKEPISQTDLIAIIKADIAEEDISEVADYAKLKGITIREAIQSPLVKGILAEKAEKRAVANGTNTAGSNRGTAKVSDEVLLSNAKKGLMPENDADITRLIKLQRAQK